MKKVIFIGVAMMLAASVMAEGMYIGGHGAFPNGGDTDEADMGFGAQLGFVVNENVSLEGSVTAFEDLDGALEITDLALSLKMSGEVSENVNAYVLGGASYVMPDADFIIDVDDEFGYHIGGGIEFAISDEVSIFADYTYTVVEFTGEEVTPWATISYEFDYEFGLVRAGANLKF